MTGTSKIERNLVASEITKSWLRFHERRGISVDLKIVDQVSFSWLTRKQRTFTLKGKLESTEEFGSKTIKILIFKNNFWTQKNGGYLTEHSYLQAVALVISNILVYFM